MDYAFLLCFEKDVEQKFQNIIDLIAESGVSNYMIDAKIPPHISVACFSADDIEPIVSELDKNITNFKAGGVVWPSLGVFAPGALYAAAVLNEYLLDACTEINRLIAPLSAVGENGFYLPYNWIPHTTLAVELNKDGLKDPIDITKAMDIALKQFSFIYGKSNRLKLVAYKCNPYVEIKTWGLG